MAAHTNRSRTEPSAAADHSRGVHVVAKSIRPSSGPACTRIESGIVPHEKNTGMSEFVHTGERAWAAAAAFSETGSGMVMCFVVGRIRRTISSPSST